MKSVRKSFRVHHFEEEDDDDEEEELLPGHLSLLLVGICLASWCAVVREAAV